VAEDNSNNNNNNNIIEFNRHLLTCSLDGTSVHYKASIKTHTTKKYKHAIIIIIIIIKIVLE
jgi:hypothetical protein